MKIISMAQEIKEQPEERFAALKSRLEFCLSFLGYQEISGYIEKYCRQEKEMLLHQAELLMEQTFFFRDRWDMEPCRTPYFMKLDSWTVSPNGDPEWVYMLNRHDFLPKLWQAYALTGKTAYIDKLRWYLSDWTEKNPITDQGTEATRTIDTGIRCFNWCGLLLNLIGTGFMDRGEAERLLENMGRQFENLRKRYIGKYTLSNWGILQTAAVCAGYLWFREFLPEGGLEEWAWKELKEQLELQILEDGSHWEQSAMYHAEVLNACAGLLVFALQAEKSGIRPVACAEYAVGKKDSEQSGKQGEGWLVRAVLVMSRHVLYSSDPARMQLPQCDSDVTDTRDVMVRAAVLAELFSNQGGVYRFAGGEHMDMASAWLLGAPGIRIYEALEPMLPEQLSWYCEDSGNLYLRNSWTETADFTWMTNGPLGSGHGHADQTQLCLYHKGRPFLIDSGRYSYREDEPLRCILKSPQAHNVCVIDGQSGGEPDGSWTYAGFGENLKNYFREQEDAHYMEMPFHGILRDGTPYMILRRVLVLDVGVWLTVQDVICPGKHQLREYFHLDDQVQVREEAGRVILKNGDVRLNVFSQEPLKTERGIISKRYNEKTEAYVLVKECEMEDRMTFSVIFAAEGTEAEPAEVFQFGRKEPVSGQTVTAWDIRGAKGQKQTILVWNRETFRGGKMYTCHGVPVYGKTVILKEIKGEYIRIRLKN